MIICPNCGYKLADGAKFCPKCGEKISGAPRPDGTVRGVRRPAPISGRLNTNRKMASFIFFNLITCGIYSFFFLYSLANDVNIACEGDGQRTESIFGFIFLCSITCGFYSLVWQYSIANRLAENAEQYGLHFQENGTTILLWASMNFVTLFMSSYMIMNILIRNTNRICAAYNQAHGY